MGGHLDEIFRQFLTVGLIFLAVVLGLWIARRYRRWMTGRLNGTRPWLTASVWGVALSAAVILAVLFGFLLDQTGAP